MGGYFFRAKDPDGLKAWYKAQLGVGGGIGNGPDGQPNPYVWYHEGGPMVFSPFQDDSDYFSRERTAMINLRVRDLDELLERLRAGGVAIVKEDRDTGIGNFARIHDPEGNEIELWEPQAE
jgi:predicted enzyme related to lactoylglutathione lyase